MRRCWVRIGWLWRPVTVGLGFVVSVLLIASPASGALSSLNGSPVQGGSCNAFSGAHALGASYIDSQVTVPACGPRPGYGGGPNVYAYPGALATAGYQCVEFSERYLYYRFGATMGIYTDGDMVVDHYASKYPSTFTAISNGTADAAPIEGDVLSFSSVSGFNGSDGGHTAVVQSSSVNSSGNGSISVIEENYGGDSGGQRTITVTNWNVGGGFPYVKWLHSKGGGPPPPLWRLVLGVNDTNGNFYAKEGGLGATWVKEAGAGIKAIAVASDPTNGPLLGHLDASGNFYAKEGGLGATWIKEAGPGIKAIAVASDPTNGPLLAFLDASGNFYAKEGGLGATWVEESGPGIKAIAVASDPTNGPQLGLIDSSGTVYAKQDGLGAIWVKETGGDVQALALPGSTGTVRSRTLAACVVPALKGKSLPAAKEALAAHDCGLGRIQRRPSSDVKRGRVISQNPLPGQKLRHGAKVALVVSKGK
jgi:hypothetical protein